MGQRFLSLRLKSLLLFSIAYAIIFGAGFYWIYTYSTQHALDEIYDKLTVTGKFVSSQIDGDEHQELYLNPDYDPDETWPDGMHDQRFWEIASLLNDFHQDLPETYLYTYVPSGPDSVEIVASHGAMLDPVEGAQFREFYTPGPDSVILQGLEEITISRNIVDDSWGSWISVFIPITNQNNEIVGALGIDYLASEIKTVQRSILQSAIPMLLAGYSIVVIITLGIANNLISPVVKLTRVASQFGKSDFTTPFRKDCAYRMKDETDQLAETLSIMVEKILERDEQIRAVLCEQQDYIVRGNPNNIYTYVNPIYCQAFGWDQQQLIGHPINLPVYEADRPKLKSFLVEKMPRISIENPHATIEIRMKLINGDIRWIQWSIRGLFNQDGTLTEYQSVGRDITDLKSLQQELENTNTKLQKLSRQLLDRRESEGKKLAQSLHDQVLSPFAPLISRSATTAGDEATIGEYQEMIRILRETIYDLRSPMLSYGLYYALLDYQEYLASRMAGDHCVIFEVNPSNVRFNVEVEEQIFRMVQEFCENIIYRQKSSQIRISGEITKSHLELIIEGTSDSINYVTDHPLQMEELASESAIGIIGMQERAELIGAGLTVDITSSKGPKVKIFFESELV